MIEFKSVKQGQKGSGTRASGKNFRRLAFSALSTDLVDLISLLLVKFINFHPATYYEVMPFHPPRNFYAGLGINWKPVHYRFRLFVLIIIIIIIICDS